MKVQSVVVQIESESYPGKFCYIHLGHSRGIGPDEIWSRHTHIATAFRNRAAAIMTIEKIRFELSKLNSSTMSSLINRLRYAKIIPVDSIESDVYVIDQD